MGVLGELNASALKVMTCYKTSGVSTVIVLSCQMRKQMTGKHFLHWVGPWVTRFWKTKGTDEARMPPREQVSGLEG